MSEQRAAALGEGRDEEPRRAGRITVEESFLDLIDQIAYGDLDGWRRLYASALEDAAVRRAVVRAAGLVEPDYATAGALWRALVERMPPVQVLNAAAVTADASRGDAPGGVAASRVGR